MAGRLTGGCFFRKFCRIVSPGRILASAYKELLKSSVADIKNISGKRYGGAINGALFLQEFVPDSIPWAHLDIAGPAWAEKDTPLEPRGGTGVGVRMMLHWLNAQ